MPESSAIRLLIADDHPVVRDGLAAMLGTQPDFAVVATAANGSEAVRLSAQLKPDVVLLDLEMPEMDGVEALARIRAASPAVRALVFTAFDTDERILGAVRAGAQGYLLKGAPRDELFRAVRVISQGGSLLQPVVASRLLQRMAGPARPANPPPTAALTSRETQVLRLMAQGLVNKEIAIQLAISERTVKFHVSAILSKLGAGNRTEAVRLAVQRGLVAL
jgi:NarL family two-component system response regulator LiaR